MTFSWPLPSLLLKLPSDEDDDYFCDDSRYEAVVMMLKKDNLKERQHKKLTIAP